MLLQDQHDIILRGGTFPDYKSSSLQKSFLRKLYSCVSNMTNPKLCNLSILIDAQYKI